MRKVLLMLLVLVGSVSMTMAQRTVKGTVKDDKGESLIGATVIVKGTTVGTTTNLNGEYSVQVPAGSDVLVVSYTGFSSQEVTIGSSNMVDVVLTQGVTLETAVVVGYGVQQKRDVTGSISQVKGDQIANLATPSFDQQLAGRAAGVQVTTPSGILGQAPQIRIRGVNSISSGTQPLVVVDGVPIFSGNVGGFTPTNALGDINPADIESMEILKDGAATAIYGSRAANGVILITTKKGSKGRVKFNYDTYIGTASAIKVFDLLNATEFVEIQNEKNRNAAGTSDIAKLQQDANGNTVESDWMDLLFRSGFQQNHMFSVSGGTDKTNYYFSLGYGNQEGIVVTNRLERYTFRGNLDQQVNNWLKIGFSSGITRQSNYGPLTGSNNLSGNTYGAMRMFPNVAVFDENDPTGYNIDDVNPRTVGRGANVIEIANGIPHALFVLDNDVRSNSSWRLLGNTYADINLFKGLVFRTQLGLDGSYVEDFLFQDPRHGDGFSANGRISQAYSPSTRWNWQNILTYNESFGRHNLGITAVQEYQKQRARFIQGTVSNLSDRFFRENVVTGTYANQEFAGGISENGIASYLGRVAYNFDRKYYISASIRQDALSALPEGTRVGYFPGASFAWRVSNENFWGSLSNTISDFRIRASYAQVGNTNIGNYPYIGSYGSGKYGLQNGISFSNFGNDQLSWEAQTKIDAGFDMGLFSDRFTFSFAYWSQDNADIILRAPTPPSVGIPGNGISKNIGQVVSRGTEWTLDGQILNSGKFRWNASINFTTQQNEVKELVDGQDIVSDFNIIRVGESINAIYGFDYYGVNPANGNPVYVKADGTPVQLNLANGAYTVFNPADPGTTGAASSLSASTDRRVLGSALPTWFGGFNNNFTYGGFDLNVFIRFSGGNMIYNRTRADLMDMGFGNNGTEILGRWQSAENPGDGVTPKIILNQQNRVNNPNVAHTRFLEKGDFVRLGNVTLGYSLPKELTQRANIDSFRVFVQAQNMLTFTDYSGIDPETNTNGFGVDWNGNPQQRILTFGLNLGF